MSFQEQVILYAKGWYGHSEDGVLKDLTILVERWSMVKPSENDVRGLILTTYLKYVTNPVHAEEGLLDALGWGWQGNRRSPEQCMLGKLSITKKGDHLSLDNIYDDIFFGPDEERTRLKGQKEKILSNA